MLSKKKKQKVKPKNTLGYLWNENLCSYKNLHVNVHSSIICNSQKLETQISFNAWMVKQTVINLYHGILLNNKNKLFIHTTTWMDLKEIILSEKWQSQQYILYDSIYGTSLKYQHYRDEGQISGCQKLEMGSAGVWLWSDSTRKWYLWWGNSSVCWVRWWLHVTTRMIKVHRKRVQAQLAKSE